MHGEAAAPSLVIVECAARWTLGDRLGAGGFGQVFAAKDEDGRLAAAKLVPKTPGAEREMLFVELGDACNVVPILDSGETDKAWVMIMPLAQRSLAQEIEASSPMAVKSALPVLRDIACALVDIDGRVVHRDIKPDNVLLLDGAWCLADFGIARYAEASTAPDTRKFAWSPPWAAPERWRHEHATIAADIYSLGVIAYQLLTATLPFQGPEFADFRDQHLHGEPPRMTGVPPPLAALIEECLYKAPEARPTSRNVQARLEGAAAEPRLGGAARLAEANEAQARRIAKRSQEASREKTEQERRASLAQASARSLQAISNEFLEMVTQVAPGSEVHPQPGGGWIVGLSEARLVIGAATAFDGRSWGGLSAPFDVVSYSAVSIFVPPDRTGYEGRSHSLYFCDAQELQVYAWFETGFMVSPLMGARHQRVPFALDPGIEAAKALGPGMAEYQVAWPFTKLVSGELDEFLDRWLGWFASAAQGQLTHPSTLPERHAEGSWRH